MSSVHHPCAMPGMLCLSCRLSAHYDVDGVADSAVLVLAKFSSALNPNMPKPRINFGRDGKACAAVETMFLIVTRWVFTGPNCASISHLAVRQCCRSADAGSHTWLHCYICQPSGWWDLCLCQHNEGICGCTESCSFLCHPTDA